MHENLWGAYTLRSLGRSDDEGKNLDREVSASTARAALQAARNRSQSKHPDQSSGNVDSEARRRLFWDAAVLHSAHAHNIAENDILCWEIDLTKAACMMASLEVTMKHCLVDVPERGLGILLCMLLVIRATSSSLLTQSVVAVAMLVPALTWQLVAHRDPVHAFQLLSIGLQLMAFECSCVAVLVASWVTYH